MQKKLPGKPFVKGDPRCWRKGVSNPGISGRPSEIHRAECRKLFEKGKFREFLSGAAKGEAVDVFVQINGKTKKIPTNFGNKLKAIAWLGEQGYGRAPVEVSHSVSDEALEKFERLLVTSLNTHFPKMCPHCKTALKMPPQFVQDLMELSKVFEREEEAAVETTAVTQE